MKHSGTSRAPQNQCSPFISLLGQFIRGVMASLFFVLLLLLSLPLLAGLLLGLMVKRKSLRWLTHLLADWRFQRRYRQAARYQRMR